MRLLGRHRFVLLGLLVAILLGACTKTPPGPQAVREEPAPPPDWIDRLYPPPGAEVAAAANVQIDHGLRAPGENLRLLIDGTDVTSYADVDRGLLVYDPDDGRAPVPLDPGSHRARVELVRAPQVGEQIRVIDVYEWAFTVQ